MQATADEVEPGTDTLPEPVADDGNPWQPGDTLTKPEACDLLGKSERTLARLMKTVLPFRLINGKAIFQRADVERLKADLETPVVRGALEARPILPGLAVSQKSENGHAGSNDTGALARIDPGLAVFLKAVAALLPAPPPPRAQGLEQWRTLKEAAEYSHLPPRWLTKQARAGVPWAMNVGTEKTPDWRFLIAGGAK